MLNLLLKVNGITVWRESLKQKGLNQICIVAEKTEFLCSQHHTKDRLGGDSRPPNLTRSNIAIIK